MAASRPVATPIGSRGVGIVCQARPLGAAFADGEHVPGGAMSDQRKQGLVEETTKVKAATAAAEILSCKSRVAAHTLPIMRPRAGMQTLVRH